MTTLEPISDTGLLLPDGLSLDEWTGVGERLLRAEAGINWAVGDWYLYGVGRWEEHVANQIAANLGIGMGHLANIVTVCRRVPLDRRRADLSFSHHAEVAGFAEKPERQSRYLSIAADENLSRSALRALIAQEQQDLAVPLEAPVQDAPLLPQTHAGVSEKEEVFKSDTADAVESRQQGNEPDGPMVITHTMRVYCDPVDEEMVRAGLSRLGRGLVNWLAEKDVVVEVEG